MDLLYHTSQGNIVTTWANMTLLPAALREAQTCRYLVYSEANFEVFRPAGRHVAPMGVKFGIPPCQISPPSVQR